MKTQCKINKIIFNDGNQLPILPNDIVVFVGANNCGKSQALKDINSAFINSQRNIVVKDIEYTINGLADFEESIKKVSSFDTKSNHYNGYGYSIFLEWIHNVRENSFNGFEQFARFFVKRIDTRDRLNQCDPIGIISKDEPKVHPMHYLAYNRELRNQIDESFFKSFGENLQLERFVEKTNYFRIGPNPEKLLKDEDFIDEGVDKMKKVLDTYPKLHEQGDGMVSFTGILLSLLVENFSVFMIDEPESFLHPPQERILGMEIPGLLGDRQAFIATHSEHFIKGLLEVASNRIKVVRITREGNTNKFKSIDTNDISKIWGDTLLKQSNVFQGLFFDSVVICESDSDCQFYSAIQAHLNEVKEKRNNPFYVYSSTKSRMKVIVQALRSFEVEYRVIADIDLLREQSDIKPLFETCGGTWNDIESDYKVFSESLKDDRNTIDKNTLKQSFIEAINNDDVENYDSISLKKLKKKITIEKKWEDLKNNGVQSLPESAKDSFEKLDKHLRERNIFLVREGELENFVSIPGHGPSWVARLFESYPNLNADVYVRVRDFITSWNL